MSQFEEHYWKELYGSGLDVDGSFNAKEHANYLFHLFQLMGIEVDSLVDFGFGQGKILKAMATRWKPRTVLALDISDSMIQKLRKENWQKSMKQLTIAKQDLTELTFDFPMAKAGVPFFAVGVLNSVLQYIPSKSIPNLLETIGRNCRYLYITVPTKEDYMAMKEEFNFHDPYANQFSKQKYRSLLTRDFEFVSFNLLQSKWFTEPAFREEIFRF